MKPDVRRFSQRREVERVDFGSAGPRHADQSGFLQHVEMLGHRLPGDGLFTLCDGHGANLEKRLVGLFAQPIYDPATDRVGQCLENVVKLLSIHAEQYAMILLHVNRARFCRATPIICNKWFALFFTLAPIRFGSDDHANNDQNDLSR